MIAASQATDTLVALGSWAVLIGGLWLLVRGIRRRRRRRDEQLWRQCNQVRHGARVAPGRDARSGRCAGTVNARGAA